jgi:predicted amidohydrolase
VSHKERITLVALQIEPQPKPDDTILQIRRLIKECLSHQQNLDCVALPEYAFGTFREWVTTKHASDQIITKIQNAIKELAKEYRVPFVAGSVPYQTEEGHWRNRSFLVSAAGEVLGSYDKQHPFRAEKKLGLEPGKQTPIFQLGHLKVAVLICSDLWYHDILGQVVPLVDFIAVPTMTTVLDEKHIQYGQWAWQSLVAVRAKEYTIPIVSADQASWEYTSGVFTCGASCIADPSYRFTDNEGPSTQALRMPPDEKAHGIWSNISLKAIKDYAAYRREVGLRE